MTRQATRKFSDELELLPEPDMSIHEPTLADEETPFSEKEPVILPPASPVEPDETPATVTASGSAGSQLRAARERQGMSIDDAAKQLYLETRILQGLEKDDYEGLPPPIFIQGYLRSYAKLLGIPVEWVMKAYQQQNPKSHPALVSEATIRNAPATSQGSRVWWTYTTWLIILVLTGLVAWRYATQQSWQLFPDAAMPTDKPADSVPTAALPPPAALHTAPPAGTPEPAYTPPSEEDGSAVPADVEAGTGQDVPPATTTVPGTPTAAATPATTVSATTTTPPATTPETAAVTAPVSNVDLLTLNFKGSTWVQVIDSKGKKIFYGTSKDKQQFASKDAVPPFKLVLGRPSQVEVIFRGQPVDLSKYNDRIARFTLGEANE